MKVVFNKLLSKKYLLIWLFIFIFLSSTGIFISKYKSDKKYIVLIVEDIATKKDKNYHIVKKLYEDLENDLNKQYKGIYFKHFSVYENGENSKNIGRLKKYVEKYKNKILLIAANNSSSTHKLYSNIIPEEIPVISTIGSKSLLEHTSFPVFSIYSTSSSRARSIYRFIQEEFYDNVIFIYEHPDVYTDETWYALKDLLNKNHNISIFQINWSDINERKKLKDLLSKTSNKTLLLFGENSTQSQKSLLLKVYPELENFKFDVFLIRIDNQPVNFYKRKIYTFSYDIPGTYLNIFSIAKEKQIMKFCRDKNKELSFFDCLNTYSGLYAITQEQIKLALDNIEVMNSGSSIDKTRKTIINRLKNTDIYNPFYNIFIIGFKKLENSKNGYINYLLDMGIYPKFIVRTDRNFVKLAKNQYNPRKIPVLYLSLDIKKIDVLDISASKAFIEGFINISKENFSIKDLHIDYLDSGEDLITNLVKSNEAINTYKFRGVFKIRNRGNLFKFPFDTQILEIKIYPKDFYKKPFFIQPFTKKSGFIKINSTWKIIDIIPSFSLEYVNTEVKGLTDKNLKNNIEVIPVIYFKVILKRIGGNQIVIKYIFPAILILILAIFSAIMIKKENIDAKIDILTNSLLGIISIYFIFSLLINIEELILIDYIYFTFIILNFLSIIVSIYLYRYKKGT